MTWQVRYESKWFSDQQPDLSYFARDEQRTAWGILLMLTNDYFQASTYQKIMRVCTSYTHPYPIKFLNHTLPFRICKLCFQANMQVTSTLWPDTKSQKISEYRFRLKWTKWSPRTKANPAGAGRASTLGQGETKTSPLQEVGGGWRPGQADQPTWSAGQARGPHRLNQGTWRFPVGSQRRFGVLRLVAPYNRRGVENRTHTHTSSYLAFLA